MDKAKVISEKRKDLILNLLRGVPEVNKLDRMWELCTLFGVTTFLAIVCFYSIITNLFFWLYLSMFLGGLAAFIWVLLISLGALVQYKSLEKDIKHFLNDDKTVEDIFGEDGLPDKDKDKTLYSSIGLHYALLPRKMMSLGVIPIIFAIAGIIISVDHPVPSLPFVETNGLVLLIILGAITEAIAFFFGYFIPEVEAVGTDKRGYGDTLKKQLQTHHQIIEKKIKKADVEEGVKKAIKYIATKI